MSDSDLVFDDEESGSRQSTHQSIVEKAQHWRVLVVDDEEEVHQITSLVLKSLDFHGRAIHLTHAYSLEEAKDILESQPPFALALIDVVMEEEDAGLQLIQFIREHICDKNIRLVLRTGQPGQAPEDTVIRKYDINDYKNKTELTSIKLKTLLYSTLRSYRDIMSINHGKQGLYQLIHATEKIVDTDQLSIFFSAVLTELSSLLNLHQDAVFARCPMIRDPAKLEKCKYQVLASTGSMAQELANKGTIPDSVFKEFDRVRSRNQSSEESGTYVGFYQTPIVGENFLYVKPQSKLTKMAIHLLNMYTRSVAITHHNLQQKENICLSKQELVYVLSEAIETRSPIESNHVRNVSEISVYLATATGMNPLACERIKLAAALHDIGTIAISDDLLEKQTTFNQHDKEIMHSHTQVGDSILGRSKRPVLKLAAKIAGQHHEHWDGNGYPNGLKGESIDIAARIVSIADTVDAMLSDRPYRNSHSLETVKSYLKKQLGRQFDPVVGMVALNNFEQITQLRIESGP